MIGEASRTEIENIDDIGRIPFEPRSLRVVVAGPRETLDPVVLRTGGCILLNDDVGLVLTLELLHDSDGVCEELHLTFMRWNDHVFGGNVYYTTH